MEGVQKTKQSPVDGSAVTGSRAEEGIERDRGPYLVNKDKTMPLYRRVFPSRKNKQQIFLDLRKNGQSLEKTWKDQ